MSDARFRLAANAAARKRDGTTRTKVIEEGKVAIQFFPERRTKTAPTTPAKPQRQRRAS